MSEASGKRSLRDGAWKILCMRRQPANCASATAPRPATAPLSAQSGQATIEFALSAVLLIGFALFFFQLSMIFAVGSYTQYATFMAARAYLSSGKNMDDQAQRAREVIIDTLKRSQGQPGIDRFPSIAKAEGGGGELPGMEISPDFDSSDRDLSRLQGIRYSFKSRIFLVPFGRRRPGADQGLNLLTLKSESWLGREPSYDECVEEMRKRGNGYYDNGC